MTDFVKRVLNREVTIGGVLETAMWLAIPYIVVGVVVAFLHADYIDMLATQFNTRLPAGADIAAFGQITVMWPGLLLSSDLCMH
ncbi:hypothetical protein [Mycolicibacterium sp. XJ870]